MDIQRIYRALATGAAALVPFIALAQQPTLAELQAQINHIRMVLDELEQKVRVMADQYNTGAYIAPGFGASTVVAGSKDAVFAHLALHAADQEMKHSSITLTLDAPEDFSQKGLSRCRLLDGLESSTASVNPVPSKNDSAGVVFAFNTNIVLPKGTSKMLSIACDVTQNPEGPATYTWRLGATSGKKILLIREGSFSVELADESPAARSVANGSAGELATVFDLYAGGEDVELTALALQIDGNHKAISAYSLWDGERQVGGGELTGDTVFKANFTDSFIIPKDSHKPLRVTIDLAPVVAGGHVQAGDTVAVNFNGSDGNFNLTVGTGVSSGRGMVPGTRQDTDAPALTIL